MKYIKLKFWVTAILVTLLWSCQTEQSVADAVAATKKHEPSPDGVPSKFDDQYNFDTVDYYYQNNKVTDTTQIKLMLKDAKVLYIDDNRADMYITETEAKEFNNKIDQKRDSNANKALIDGDNYMFYLFELTKYSNNDNRWRSQQYAAVLGPKSNYNDYGQQVSRTVYDFYGSSTPPQENTSSVRLINFTDVDPRYYHIYYQINVKNTTRFRRQVIFQAADPNRRIYYNIDSGASHTFNGNKDGNGYAFNGTSFTVVGHTSNKI